MPPQLVDLKGKPVEVTGPDADAVNARFDAAMNDDRPPQEQAPPRRQPRPPADPDAPKPRRGRPPKAEQSRSVPVPPPMLVDAQRAAGAKGIAQFGAGLALMIGKATKSQAFEADALTIAGSADQLADAAVQIAKTDPAFAARLDKVCAALLVLGADRGRGRYRVAMRAEPQAGAFDTGHRSPEGTTRGGRAADC